MIVTLAEPSLDALDALRGECLVLTAFREDRPLRGAAGLVDWRLCGRLSQWMQREIITLQLGQATLAPIPAGRLPMDTLLVVGCGRRSEFDAERHEQACVAVLRHLRGLQLDDVVVSLPGRIGVDIAVRAAVASLGRALLKTMEPARLARLHLTLLEQPDMQRELADPLAELARLIDAEVRAQRPDVADAMVVQTPADDNAALPRDWRRGLVRLPPAPDDAATR